MNKTGYAPAAAKSLQSCPTLCDPINGSPPGSPIPGILQARTLEWVAISFSSAYKWKVKAKLLSRIRLLVTPWTAAHQTPPSMGFSRQEDWSGVPVPSLRQAIPALNELSCNIRQATLVPETQMLLLHTNLSPAIPLASSSLLHPPCSSSMAYGFLSLLIPRFGLESPFLISTVKILLINMPFPSGRA